MEGVHFSVVHFNNGMHGWGYTEEQYRNGFPRFLNGVKALGDKKGVLIWASTTPVQTDEAGGATNSRIEARNEIALKMVKSRGIVVDDQHRLMMSHEDLHEDRVHFSPKGAAIQGDQAAAIIRSILVKGD